MRVLYVYNDVTTFTKYDLDIVARDHDVRELLFRRDGLAWLRCGLQAFRDVWWSNAIFSWFGSFHSLLPFALGRVLGRKCVVIASGYDVACLPEIGYGNMSGGLRRLVGRAVFRLAHKVLAVSRATAREAVANARVDARKIEVIYHGVPRGEAGGEYDPSCKEEMVITVGMVERSNLTRKGHANFVEAARYLPDVPFVLIGAWKDDAIEKLKAMAPPNVRFTGWLTSEEVESYMRRASVYVQTSAHEAFGMAVAEAMLRGCVPVVSDRGALPEVVGDCGVIVRFGDAEATAAAIRAALPRREELARRAHDRVKSSFSLPARRRQLIDVLQRVCSNEA
jgi:glycosyltransferase involved in cell wall biosynthesis